MKTCPTLVILGLFTIFLSPVVMAAQVPDVTAGDMQTLVELVRILDQEQELDKSFPGSASQSCAVESFRTALQYVKSPSTYKHALFQQYSVNDYPARAKGVYNMVPGDKVIGVVKDIETKYPQIADSRVQLVIAFCAFRDENIWFDTSNGRISAARFFRSAFLATVFKGSGIDAASITDEIDAETKRTGGY